MSVIKRISPKKDMLPSTSFEFIIAFIEMFHELFSFFTEMLALFTEKEKLEGKIYACEQCNSK